MMEKKIRITLEGTEMSVEHSDGVDINDSAYMLLTAAAATMVQGNVSRKLSGELFNDAYSQAAKIMSGSDSGLDE